MSISLSHNKCLFDLESISELLNVIHWSASFSFPVPCHTFYFYKFTKQYVTHRTVNYQTIECNEKPLLKQTQVKEMHPLRSEKRQEQSG